jgi:aspartyl-tRNA(Asn)/glutamyl-tRNA(Gln) amidotransferase subunit C
MTIRREEVERIAELARLEIPESGMERMAAELSAVLDFVKALDRLDLTGRSPLSFAPAGAPLRADEPNGRRLEPEDALAMAPEAEAGCFLVPPVVENLNP